MPVEVPKRCSFAEILLAIEARLVAFQVLPASRVFIVARSTSVMPNPVGPSDITLRPRGFIVDQDMAIAGGRYTTKLTRVVDVIIRLRSELDKAGSDKLFLTKDAGQAEAVNYFALEEKAISALQIDADLKDVEGNVLVCCPIRIVDGTTPDKNQMVQNPGWGNSAFGVSCEYLPDIDIAVQ